MTLITNSDVLSGTRFLPQIFAALSATLFAISDGMSYAWTSPMVPYLISEKSHIRTNIQEAEWLESTLLYGSLFGLPFTLLAINKFGRKRSLIFATIAIVIAWSLIAFGDRMIYLFIGRFISGIASDMAYIACPMYISEISDRKIRGFLSGIVFVMDHIGSLTVYCLGSFTSYYTAPILGSVVALIELVLLCFVPESPFFLLVKGQDQKAREALLYFKSYKNIDKEIKDITEMLDKQKKIKEKTKDLFTLKSNRKALIIIAVINLGPQLLGYTAILMNLQIILDSAGSIYMESSRAAILYGSIMLVATIFCSISVDRFGRKILMGVSASISGLCVLTLAIYFHLKSLGFNLIQVSWIPIVSVMIFGFLFKIGIGIVPMILTAEIAPSNFRATGIGFGDTLMIIGSIFAVQIYQFVSKLSDMYLPFYIYCVWAIVLTVFTFMFIPETKGIALDDIQKILNGERVERRKSSII